MTQKNVGVPTLPEGSQWERNVLNSFAGGKATPTTYEGGTTLYRIGGKNGGFWSLEPPPATEYQWRVDYAIKQEFCNDASTLYKMTIPEGSSLGALEMEKLDHKEWDYMVGHIKHILIIEQYLQIGLR